MISVNGCASIFNTGLCGLSLLICIINNLMYADDTVIITKSEEQLQSLINRVVTDSEKGYII